MPRTREQIEQAARDAADWIEGLDPDDPTGEAHPVDDLRAVGLAFAAVASAESNLAATVSRARAAGHSWGRIGQVLGVSKQAVQKRYEHATVPEQQRGEQ